MGLMSTTGFCGAFLAVGAVILLAGGCGWKAGPHAGIGLSVGEVSGATVEPGLRAALRHELTRALRDRGVAAGGRAVDLSLIHIDHRPSAALDRSVAWTGEITVEVRIADREDCHLTVEGRRTWTLGPGTPDDAALQRAEAISVLAQEVGERAADALLGDPKCR